MRAVAAINAPPGQPLRAIATSDEAAARQLILTRRVEAAFLLNPNATTDTVLVASGAGPALASAAEQTLAAAAGWSTSRPCNWATGVG